MASNVSTGDRVDAGGDDFGRRDDSYGREAGRAKHDFSFMGNVRTLLEPLASLKLTVVLFGLAMFLVFAGTLAQTQMDVWDVVAKYFRTFVAKIHLQSLFPRSFFPQLQSSISPSLYFLFPGGFTIGAAMFVNLLAAHGLKFKVQARGQRLWAGLGVVALGAALTYAVVTGGSDHQGFDGSSQIDWTNIWWAIQALIVVAWAANLAALIQIVPTRVVERRLLLGSAIAGSLLLAWLAYRLVIDDPVILGDSSMRILWQLMKATLASLVLLGGCALLFNRRAGIVLLHAGILLVMVNEVVVYGLHSEGHMRITEGQSTNFVSDIRSYELAVTDSAPPASGDSAAQAADTDDVVVIPRNMVDEAATTGETIKNDLLPFDIKIVHFLQNATFEQPTAEEKNLATAGLGTRLVAKPVAAGTGTDVGGEVDQTTAYVEFLDKKSGESLGVHMLSVDVMPVFQPEPVTVGDKTYEVALRFKRVYQDFSVHLVDVRKEDYPGTTIPKYYSSDIWLVDEGREVARPVHIYMNNPLRFAGQTFYQSGYNVDPRTGEESTTLQVVANAGWMIPYVACMIVVVGLLGHFGITLLRFLQRRQNVAVETKKRLVTGVEVVNPSIWSQSGVVAQYFPLAIVLVFGGYMLSKARPESRPSNDFQYGQFGKLPVMFEGRVKPMDTLARNALRIISGKETFEIEGKSGAQPATRWLLDVISESSENHRVFRIENTEVQELFGLKPRAGYRYSLSELRPKADLFSEQVRQAESLMKSKPESVTTYHRKLMELDKRTKTFTLLAAAMRMPDFPPDLTPEDRKEENIQAAVAKVRRIAQFVDEIPQQQATLMRFQPPLAIPPVGGSTEWHAVSNDWLSWFGDGFRARLTGGKPPEKSATFIAFDKIMDEYQADRPHEFNAAVAKYQELLAKEQPDKYSKSKVNFEAFFNSFAPFYYAVVLYVAAFVLAGLAWLGWSRPLNRAAFWLITFTFVMHTLALIGRIYISGRPPVTNLYSSAVFIGWATVGLGLILERIYRLGVGNMLAAITGFATLLIAHNLAADGDTLAVLQAVLDTQFWLATHVVCITLGYATTFLAGFLGLMYIARGLFTTSLTTDMGKDISRMIYGATCFAIFFSFFGTVLGGLWADDSWGRFWGWDPKENGALMIVLWNAIILHARWGGMAKERGMAVLAVAGNIVTAWSWFGVNELGVGKHSYGFTEGVLKALGAFIASQFVFIVLGMLPKDLWPSSSPRLPRAGATRV